HSDLEKGTRGRTVSFAGDRSREQVIVFLGDGMSVFNPISTADRTRLCENMVKNHIVFYSVPLGPRLEAKNLHGFATGTGGTVVRVLGKDTAKDVVTRIQEAVAAPILYPSNFKLAGNV